ncbi:MAG: hypothetical protein ACYTFY_18410 [Planctomycetota bacterium]|jgi:hypothetical protein
MNIFRDKFELVFNHDGFGILEKLAETEMTENDADDILVKPWVESAVSALDWCIITTGHHNCRTRHQRLHNGEGKDQVDKMVGKAVQHYSKGEKDLLDIVIECSHKSEMPVFGNIRLNHTGRTIEFYETLPGKMADNDKKDFRDQEFQSYLCEVYEDLLAKGIDALSLDFERKAPFFPDSAPEKERTEACKSFLRKIRNLSDKPVIARVAYEREKGIKQGQLPEEWLAEGLIDIVIPATHNHEADPLDWKFDRFLEAAAKAPHNCQVWPQIWPTYGQWGKKGGDFIHKVEDIEKRIFDIKEAGADGVYFFNFHCLKNIDEFQKMFCRIKDLI